MVNNAEQARKAVAACKYPPEGIRGMGTARAQGYGKWQSDYYASANENILVCVQIEHVDAIRNIEEILAVPGIDAIFIGRNDLSASMGFRGGDSLPEVWAETEKVISAARKAKVPAGMYIPKVADAPPMVKAGYTFLTIGADSGILLEECSNICMEFAQMLEKLKSV